MRRIRLNTPLPLTWGLTLVAGAGIASGIALVIGGPLRTAMLATGMAVTMSRVTRHLHGVIARRPARSPAWERLVRQRRDSPGAPARRLGQIASGIILGILLLAALTMVRGSDTQELCVSIGVIIRTALDALAVDVFPLLRRQRAAERGSLC